MALLRRSLRCKWKHLWKLLVSSHPKAALNVILKAVMGVLMKIAGPAGKITVPSPAPAPTAAPAPAGEFSALPCACTCGSGAGALLEKDTGAPRRQEAGGAGTTRGGGGEGGSWHLAREKSQK